MDLLLHSDILVECCSGIFNPEKSGITKYVSEIVSNETNSFILNKQIITEYELRLKEQFDNNLDTFYPILTELINNKIDIDINNESNNSFQEIEKGYLSRNQYAKSVIYSNLSYKRDNSLKNKYSCIYEEIYKPNVHWLISRLAINRSTSLTMRYFDFKSDNEIQELFDNLFILSDRHSDVIIYDRQINFSHDLFRLIKNSRTIHYYTAFSANDITDNDEIRKNFKRVRIFKAKRSLIHERKLIIRDLIVEADNDFWNLRCCEPTWKIDITLCTETSQKLINKNPSFRRIL